MNLWVVDWFNNVFLSLNDILPFQQVIVSRYYRDMRLVSIGGGADEVMLSIICKYMGILPKHGKKKQ